MKCEKCGGEWISPKNISIPLTNCPFCNAPILDVDKAKSFLDMGMFLQYMVSLYGVGLYDDQQKLNNLIADFYQGNERMKHIYQSAIRSDSLSKRIYELSLKSLKQREEYYNQLANQFSETNFYTLDFGKKIIDSFISGLKLEIISPVTKATEEDGEWIDEYGVIYSADRKKLIGANGVWIDRGIYSADIEANGQPLKSYKIKEGTVVICDDAFAGCESLTRIVIPNSVIYIGSCAFNYCESLTSVEIPNSVTFISEWAFAGCKSLTRIIIPNSVTYIGAGSFERCYNLYITLESNSCCVSSIPLVAIQIGAFRS